MNNREDVMSKSNSNPPPAPAPAPGGGPMAAPPKQPWSVDVDIYLTKGCPDPQFEIKTSLPIDPATGNIIFHNNRRPGFIIRFNLHDETGTNPPFVFPPQPQVQAACWSETGAACPQAPVWQVFDPRRVLNHGKTLEVYNQNPSPALGAFKYTLRVTNDGGATYCDLDPGGDDLNGPDN